MRKQLAVVVLTLGLAGCKRTTAESTPVAPVVAPVFERLAAAPSEPFVLVGHAMCVSLRRCMDIAQPMILRRPMGEKVTRWYEKHVANERPSGVLLFVRDFEIVPVFVVPIRDPAEYVPEEKKYVVRVVGDHALVGTNIDAVTAAMRVDVPPVDVSGPELVVDGRLDLARVPKHARESWVVWLYGVADGVPDPLNTLVPFGLAQEALAEARSVEVDLVETAPGRLELDGRVVPEPGTALAAAIAANAAPRSQLASLVPADALAQAGIKERMRVEGVGDDPPLSGLVNLATMIAATTSVPEAARPALQRTLEDLAAVAHEYMLGKGIEILAYVPAGSTGVVAMLRGLDTTRIERVLTGAVEVARTSGIWKAKSQRKRGVNVHTVTIPGSSAPADIADFGRDFVAHGTISGDTLVLVVGGDKKLPELLPVARALPGATAIAVANRWISVDMLALARQFTPGHSILREFGAGGGTISLSLQSDGEVWRVRARCDLLSPENLARQMK